MQNENGKCVKLKYTSNFQLLVGLPHLSDIQAHDAQNTKQNQELHDITWRRNENENERRSSGVVTLR